MSAVPATSLTPRTMMLSAVVLMALSQFAHYQGAYRQEVGVAIGGGGGGDHAVPNLATGFAVAKAYDHIGGVSGWSLHHNAWIILLALFVMFAGTFQLGAWWARWSYWVGVGGLVLCLFPTDFTLAPAGFGFIVGLVAVGLGVWAARNHGKALKFLEEENP